MIRLSTSPPDAPTGAREPKHRLVPERAASAGPDAAELAATAGLRLDPWEADVLDGALGERADGSPAAGEVGLVAPRQNGKGAILEAAALYSLFLTGAELVLWSAHEFKTAQEAFRRVRALVEGCDFMRRRVAHIRTANGDEGIELTNGSRLRFVARSRGSGRGFAADLVILDEAFALDDDEMAALLPSLSARDEPQVWYVSSAPHLTSGVLRRVCRRGRRGEGDRLAYFEWCADDAAESGDVSAWLQANPGIGHRLTLDWIARELDALDAEDFRRERLGIWPEDVTEQFVDLSAWGELEDSQSQPSDPVVFAFDVAPDRGRSAIAVAGGRPDGTCHVEVVEDRPGTGWVVGRLVELVDAWEPAAVMVDARGPASSLLPALADKGVEVTSEPQSGGREMVVETNASEMARACGALFDAITDGTVRHLGQPSLDQALGAAARRPLGDAWAWSRKYSQANIAPLVAVTLAFHGWWTYAGREPKAKPFVIVS